ncbi:MAG: DNA translocase FtsK [Flavobacteriales bacterium]|jgi:S-DNA-T family DNA segregation ATPase FtsK/SpoIIIE|nr:DNA translocase FtsK [Flavobacteriales bacterium]
MQSRHQEEDFSQMGVDPSMEPHLKERKWHDFLRTDTTRLLWGLFLIVFSVVLIVTFFDYIFNWKSYQSLVSKEWSKYMFNKNIQLPNGTFFTRTAHFFIYKQIGLAIFILPIIMLLVGLNNFMQEKVVHILPVIKKSIFWALWLPISLAFFFNSTPPILGGHVGFTISENLSHLLGNFGTLALILFFLFSFLVINYGLKINPKSISKFFKDNPLEKAKKMVPSFPKKESKTEMVKEKIEASHSTETPIPIKKEKEKPKKESISKPTPVKEVVQKIEEKTPTFTEDPIKTEGNKVSFEVPEPVQTKKKTNKEPEAPKDLEIIVPEGEKIVPEIKVAEVSTPKEIAEPNDIADKLVEEYGEFDPTLELGNYEIPPLSIMEEYEGSDVSVDPEELQSNKEKIVETLRNYKIEISSISATVGPTITLYEIVPAPGVRISKIKGLENDIALSLAALGIRIIAPLPGKGTIGIEVPTKNPKIVSMKSVLLSEKFQNAKMELPVALGKTISNETYVADLAKMPHLLMAGATGQGKSVGLNAILTSLLYKKHPAELKLVLVDPKKVELTLYNHIERHFLAKLPGDGEAIITENKLVVNTVNSLCVEMDARYELLKKAHCRNLKEYNVKFRNRKLNPENGHRFLPYIVLVIDEFADLIMTAGKEIELPIARLAQLARAVGIHLIVATQRPTTNIITGTIKANFPARIAFRVTSNTDSRTILDASGANQLIGRGDMLYSNGNDLVRIQCAFVDTPEVEELCEYIGSQKGYPQAFQLPEFVGEDSGDSGIADIDLNERDAMFEEAAKVVVLHQQGSTSLIQRKLKLGYNRAGRIMDQLEAAGIVGPFAGSKARDVLIPDEYALEQFLNEL